MVDGGVLNPIRLQRTDTEENAWGQLLERLDQWDGLKQWEQAGRPAVLGAPVTIIPEHATVSRGPASGSEVGL